MKHALYPALCALTLTSILLGPAVFAQDDHKSDNIKPAPVIVRFQAHSMSANDFQVARSKHREIELEIKQKGIDLAYTEWMQRDHPYVFAAECVKDAGKIATEYKSTNHMIDFDTLMQKRADLRIYADHLGHDAAFADWLRRERPDVYRAHFGIKSDMKMHREKRQENKENEKTNP